MSVTQLLTSLRCSAAPDIRHRTAPLSVCFPPEPKTLDRFRSGPKVHTLKHNLGCSTPQSKEGYVVLLLPALPHERVEFLQAQIPQRALLTLLGDECPKLGEAEHLTFWVVGLYQPISVEKGAVCGLEHHLLLLIAHARHETKGHPPGSKFLGGTTMPEVGQVVARVGVGEGSALRIEDAIEASYEHVLRDARQQRLVNPLEYLPR